MMAAAADAPTDPSAVEFPTRVDGWLLAMVVGSGVIALGAVALAAREDPREAALGTAVLLGSFGVVAALAVPTRYTLGEHELVVRSGLLRTRIPLDAIRRVYPTRNPLSAPAWSLDRLGVQYDRPGRGRGLVLISPDRREAFLSLLGTRAGLVREGGELRRVP